MFRSIIPVAALLFASGLAMAAARSPAHRALAQPVPAARAGCLDNSRSLSHIAYVPTALQQVPRCGHLLATDTLIAVRHWNRT
jgi:hypothetical protein